jgi:hypothetical protein
MKKYSEKFINNSDILKKSIIGMEFEFYMTDLSFYKTLEILNQYLDPVCVYGFREYHSGFVTTDKNWKIEPDLSLGSFGLEIITGPMDYYTAKFYLIKMLKFIQEYGYTNDKSSIHFNISFSPDSDKDLNDLNVLKLILDIDEDEIFRSYPSRKNNVYAKSVKKIIPYKEYDFNNIDIDIVKNNLRLPGDKYYGINLMHINNNKESQRLEFRYIGGKDYEKNIGGVTYFMDKFIITSHDAIGTSFDDGDITDLEFYLDQNISNFRGFSKYDNFIVEFPTISLQIDQRNDYDIVNTYYTKIYNKLFSLIDCTNNLKDCIINYVTISHRLEIIDADIKSNFNMVNFDFINCTITDGIFNECNFINSEITNSQIIKSGIDGSDITGSKIINCIVNSTVLNNCFFMGGYLNAEMNGGVYRSGKIGSFANISSDTKIITDTNSFFDTKIEDDTDKSKDLGIMKAFKNNK